MRPPSRLLPLICLTVIAAIAGPALAVGGYGTVRTIGSGDDTVLVLYAGGTPYEIGWWHGTLLQSEVQDNISTTLAIARAQVGPTALRTTWNLLAPYVPQEFNDELQGLADGSGVPLSDLQDLHALPDLSEFHCSAFNAFGPATASGHMIQMRILDYSMDLGMQDYPLVIVATPTNGHRYVNIAFAGFIGSIAGISSQGIGVSEMGDSYDYANETLSGIPMPFLLRNIIAHATSVSQALTMVQSANRTSSYWYMVGDAEATNAYTIQASPTIFSYWGPGSEPSPLPALANVCYVGHYNDRLYADLSANWGAITPAVGIAIARHNAMASNLMDAVYDLTTQEIWVAYAQGLLPASGQAFSYLATAEPPDRIDDNFENPTSSAAEWYVLGPKVTFKTADGSGVMELQGAEDPANTLSEALALAAQGATGYVDGLTIAADMKIVSGSGGLSWGSEGMVMGATKPQYVAHVVQLDPANDQVTLATEGEGVLAVATLALDLGAWYRVQVVSTLTNFEVWVARRGQALAKVIDVAQDVLHPGTDAHLFGGMGFYAENTPGSTVQVDNFTASGVAAAVRRFICPNVRALREQPAVVPVYINDAGGAARLDFDMLYDTSLLTGLTGAQVQKGALVAGAGWTLTWQQVAAGHVRVRVSSSTPLAAGAAGEVARLTFAVNPAAVPRGATALLDLDAVAQYDALGSPISAGAWDGAVRIARMAERIQTGAVSTPQYVNTAFPLTMQARDEYNDVPAGYAATVNLTDLTGGLAPTSVTFAAGSYSGNVTVSQAHAADRITATQAGDSAVTGISNTFEVRVATDIPAAPTNLAATATSSTRIVLTWADNATNETGYYVERKTWSNGTYARIATLAANAISYANTTCTEGVVYYYRVQAYRSLVGTSGYSNEAMGTTPLKTPTTLAATAAGLTQVNLSWNDNSAVESGYLVERKLGTGGTYAQVASVAANTKSWSDTGLTAGNTYVYRVRCYRLWVGYSAYSNEASMSLTQPPAPSNLAASATSPTRIVLAWTDNATNETGYYVERKTWVNGTYARIATVAANVTTYANTTCTEGTIYYYRVQAYRAGTANSNYSNEAPGTTPLKTPTTLTVTAPALTQVNLSWKDNSAVESGYLVERKLGTGGTYAQVASLAANVKAWSDTGLTAGNTYVYRVRCYRTNVGYSAYSNEATISLIQPAAPSNLAASATSPTRVALTWADNATDETGFYIERKTWSNGTYARVATVAANVTTYANTTCTEGILYYYRVQAYRTGAVNSAYSNEASAATPLKTPTGLTATAAGSGKATLSWGDNSTVESNYLVERKLGATGTYAQVASLAANIKTWADTGLTPGNTYVYRVRCYRLWVGYSAYSNEATVVAQ